MGVNARLAGFVAALLPLSAVIFGASLIELIPRVIVGGVLVFVGLAFIVEWVWDKRRSLPITEYLVVLVILATIIVRACLPGVVVGLVLAVVLFAVNYSRLEQVTEVDFGETYPATWTVRSASGRRFGRSATGSRSCGSTGSCSSAHRAACSNGSASGWKPEDLRFLLIDLRSVTGMDSSAVMSFRKIVQLAEANGFELVLTGGPQEVGSRLARGGVVAAEGVVRFEPDLDRGLQRGEDVLLGETGSADHVEDVEQDAALAGLPTGLRAYLERMPLAEGTTLIRQDDPPDDVFVLESGRLSVEMETPEGTRLRLRSVRPGVVVGEIAMYTGVPRTADVVTETPSVVLRLSKASIERLEAEEPELAAALHRWLASTLAERLSDTLRAYDALLD